MHITHWRCIFFYLFPNALRIMNGRDSIFFVLCMSVLIKMYICYVFEVVWNLGVCLYFFFWLHWSDVSESGHDFPFIRRVALAVLFSFLFFSLSVCNALIWIDIIIFVWFTFLHLFPTSSHFLAPFHFPQTWYVCIKGEKNRIWQDHV